MDTIQLDTRTSAPLQALPGRDTDQREALILGAEPRIPPLPVKDLTGDLERIVMQMIEVNAALNSRDKEALTDLMSDHAADASAANVSAQLANLPEIVRT